MAEQAHVRSIDDLARFRAALVTFLAGARAAVEECSVEVGRQQAWLEHDRRRHWEAEANRRQRRLEEAREAAFTDALASQRGPGGWHQMQVRRAQQAVEEAAAKLERVRKWGRSFQNTSLPLLKQVERLQAVLSVDMARAVHALDQSLLVLEAYSGRFQPARPSSSAPVDAPVDAPNASTPPASPGPFESPEPTPSSPGASTLALPAP